MPELRSIAFFVNPHAGSRKSDDWRHQIAEVLRGKSVKYDIIETRHLEDVQAAVIGVRDQMDAIVAVGGDGTVHHVAQSLVGSKCLFGVLPNGSGNDFSRLVGMPKGISEGVEVMLERSRMVLFDTIEVIVRQSNSTEELRRWSVNTAGVGFDAASAHMKSQIPILRGLPLYLVSALLTLASFRAGKFSIETASRKESFSGLLVVVGVGQFEGGGFRVLPGAIPDDGIMEICEVAVNNRRKALPLLLKAIEGHHVGREGVTTDRGLRLNVKTDRPMPVHADGEVVSLEAIEVDFVLRTGGLRVLLPN